MDTQRVASTEIAGWVRESNVRRLMVYISLWIGYRFDDVDWQAIEDALPDTDTDSERWYDYPLVGDPDLVVWLAINVGAVPVSVKVVGDMDAVLAARVDTAIELL